MSTKENLVFQFIFDIFSGKVKTRVYVTFLGWVLFFHIDVIFIALFLDQSIIYEKTKLLKGEYILSYIFHFNIYWSLTIEVARFVLATAVTYLMIWVVPPMIDAKSYKRELESEYILRKMKLKKDEELNKKEESVVKKQQENLEAQLENIEVEKKVAIEKVRLQEVSESSLWEKDFNSFKSLNVFKEFERVITCVYQYGGNQSKMYSKLPTALIAYLDSNDVISITGEYISFTEKGRHFVKKYTESENNRA